LLIGSHVLKEPVEGVIIQHLRLVIMGATSVARVIRPAAVWTDGKGAWRRLSNPRAPAAGPGVPLGGLHPMARSYLLDLAVSKESGIQTFTPSGQRVCQGFSLTEAGLGISRRVVAAALEIGRGTG